MASFDGALYCIVGNRVGTTDNLIPVQTRAARTYLTGVALSVDRRLLGPRDPTAPCTPRLRSGSSRSTADGGRLTRSGAYVSGGLARPGRFVAAARAQRGPRRSRLPGLVSPSSGGLAPPGRFELPTTGSVDRCSIQLSYGSLLRG